MNRLFVLAGALALGVIVAGSNAEAEDKDPPSIKEIMTKAHKGGNAILAKAKAAEKDKDFDTLVKLAGTLVKLGEDLSKAKPDKGEEKSWKTLTSNYVKTAKSLETAAKDKDESGAKKALGAINTSCGRCHKAHKG